MASSCRRPEHMAPPDVFYNEEEAKKYSQNSRMIEIQTQMSERAVELLNLPEEQPCFLLDVGCGSGLSGDYLSEEGHYWVGIDISTAMLDVALNREVEGDLVLGDMGHGMPFRPGTFDGCISISALQWLCNADKKSHSPPKRLFTFFSTLYSSLARGSRAVFQLYPENSEQLELITTQAMKAGFSGGMVVDYPNSSKAKKFFLCLFAGVTGVLPKGLGSEMSDRAVSNQVQYSGQRDIMRAIRKEQPRSRHQLKHVQSYVFLMKPDQKNRKRATVLSELRTLRCRFKNMKGKSVKKGRDWIFEKKERRRRQGREVRADTKYTGRQRRPHF